MDSPREGRGRGVRGGVVTRYGRLGDSTRTDLSMQPVREPMAPMGRDSDDRFG